MFHRSENSKSGAICVGSETLSFWFRENGRRSGHWPEFPQLPNCLSLARSRSILDPGLDARNLSSAIFFGAGASVQALKSYSELSIRVVSILGVMSLLAAPMGCRAPRSVTVSDAAGSYEYHSGNRALGTICFELEPDGSYHLGNAKEPLSSMSVSGSQGVGRWTLSGGPPEEILLLGKSSLPIERTGSSIRVTVDDDLGMYCDSPIR